MTLGGNTDAKGVGIPRGSTILTNVKGVCAPLLYSMGDCGGPLLSSGSGHYINWKEGVFCRASSQMWGSWNFPRFLFMDGSLTLMIMASLMFLVMP